MPGLSIPPENNFDTSILFPITYNNKIQLLSVVYPDVDPFEYTFNIERHRKAAISTGVSDIESRALLELIISEYKTYTDDSFNAAAINVSKYNVLLPSLSVFDNHLHSLYKTMHEIYLELDLLVGDKDVYLTIDRWIDIDNLVVIYKLA